MTPSTLTCPGTTFVVEEEAPKPETCVGTTAGTSIMDFEDIKSMLSPRPLTRPNRTCPLEDLADIQAADERRDEPREDWDDVKKDLGL